MTVKAVQQYLQHYSEPEARQLTSFPAALAFSHVLVIPAYRESAQFIERLRHAKLAHENVLFIVVINQPDTDYSEQNQQLWQALHKGTETHWQQDNLTLLGWPSVNSTLLLVDRFQAGRRIPDKQGVGLARKIGADIAAALIKQNHILTPWIHSSDADAHLPNDYFSVAALQNRQIESAKENYGAIVYPFEHLCDDSATGIATQLYEQALNYYVEGLRWAGSPYAFHTIGSILAFNVDHYCQARGFPRRAGGEDFYLLNKIAKLAPVYLPESSPVKIEARLSDRVPFGTGPAVQTIVTGLGNSTPVEQVYCYYHPMVFTELKHWLVVLNGLWQEQSLLAREQLYASLSQPIQTALDALNIESLLTHIQRQIKTEAQFNTHIHSWFDAFRTLKFIHALQKHYYPALPLQEAIGQFTRIKKVGHGEQTASC